MLLSEIVATSTAVGATRSRKEKVERLSETLRRLAPDEIAAGVAFLSGEPRQRQTGVGWRSLRELPGATAEPALGVVAVDTALQRIADLAGPGSQAARRQEVAALFAQATETEQPWLVRLILGDLKQGALEGIMVEAVAAAADAPRDAVRRAHMLRGSLGAVAEVALTGGDLAQFRLEVGRPVHPMLAGTAPDIPAALEKVSPAGVEYKLDGARIQVHRSGDEIAIFTRSLDDVTARLPEVVEVMRALPYREAVLDGEAIALRDDGTPYPFQVTGSRFASKQGSIPLTPLLFDVLHVDGEDVLDLPGAQRAALLPEHHRVPRVVAGDVESAQRMFDEALARGHEGVVVKALDAPYAAGRRGAGWLKVKPRITLDLVILGAEWGHGRRQGWLSNLHLGARHEDGFVMLGKTFKGLTDEMLAWQTERLLALETHREGITVHVRPELVAEIAFDGVQASPRYPGGVALRFARVLRHRPDKPASEAETLETILGYHSSA
jgi:DNA ligase-1